MKGPLELRRVPVKNHLLTWLHHALLHASCKHNTYSHNPETPFDAFLHVIVNCFSFMATTEKFACLATFEFNFHGVQQSCVALSFTYFSSCRDSPTHKCTYKPLLCESVLRLCMLPAQNMVASLMRDAWICVGTFFLRKWSLWEARAQSRHARGNVKRTSHKVSTWNSAHHHTTSKTSYRGAHVELSRVQENWSVHQRSEGGKALRTPCRGPHTRCPY